VISRPGAAKRKTPILWAMIGVLGVAFLVVAVYRSWPILFPRAFEMAPLDPTCDLRKGPCVSKLAGGGEISLSIEPRSLPVVQPLELSVQAHGLQAAGVEVDFRGVGMNMGFNRPRLEPAGSPGLFEGAAMLPVCLRERMTWEAKVLVETPDGLVAAPFRFDTVKPGTSITE
jgi:hypothetical protein